LTKNKQNANVSTVINKHKNKEKNKNKVMTKIPITYISSVTKLQPTVLLPEPIEVSDQPHVRSR